MQFFLRVINWDNFLSSKYVVANTHSSGNSTWAYHKCIELIDITTGPEQFIVTEYDCSLNNCIWSKLTFGKVVKWKTTKILPSTDLIVICQRENGNFSIEGGRPVVAWRIRENVEIFVVGRFMTLFSSTILKRFVRLDSSWDSNTFCINSKTI